MISQPSIKQPSDYGYERNILTMQDGTSESPMFLVGGVSGVALAILWPGISCLVGHGLRESEGPPEEVSVQYLDRQVEPAPEIEEEAPDHLQHIFWCSIVPVTTNGAMEMWRRGIMLSKLL